MEEITNIETQESNGSLLRKWLQVLLYVKLATVVIAVPSLIPAVQQWLKWFTYILTIGAIYILMKLAPACIRYRKAAVLNCVYLAGVVLAIVLKNAGIIISLMTLAGSICGIIATYQEYHGHADMVKGADEKLANRWSSLFIWQLVVGILLGVGTSVGVIISIFSGGAISAEGIVAVISLPSLVLQAVYLLYLKRTLFVLQ